jgi:DNA sulfur modification protein DndB
MDKKYIEHQKLILPTLRGKMGDWFYYVTLMPFKEIADRVVSLTSTPFHSQERREFTQSDMTHKTQEELVEYLKKQEQRFFNSLIVGIYDGNPTWQELDVLGNKNIYEEFPEERLDYLSRTFGILTLNGDENIFVINGQPQTHAIKNAIKQDNTLETEELAVIFVAHKNTPEGRLRTNRLVSNLNQYAHL